ncbi:hypothetical protein [Celeribacter sp.]|uniref:hypothetical protein n=1 Tax=Celeribacter sp. TaxID=1890673 RepID=UPI003A94499F
MALKHPEGKPSTEFSIGTATFVPMLERAAVLWEAILSELECNPAYAMRVEKARVLREAFGPEDNYVVTIIAEYLSAMKYGHFNAKAVDKAANDGAELLRRIKKLRGEIENFSGALAVSQRSDVGEDVWGDFFFADSLAREATVTLEAMAEHLNHATERLPRTTEGVDKKMRQSPEETFAMHLGQYWAAAGLSTDGGESGSGIDDVLGFVIEETDPKRKSMKSRKKWLAETLMPIAKNAGQSVRDGLANGGF